MSNVDFFLRASERLPDFRAAHWVLRVLLAAIIVNEAFNKVPLSASDAESFGVPLVLWGMAALGELIAGIALITGGLMRNALGDVITRLGGLMLAVIVISVLVVVYWAPPLSLFLGNQVHLLLLAGGLYFLARGNKA